MHEEASKNWRRKPAIATRISSLRASARASMKLDTGRSTMQERPLGSSGLRVSALGLGCMGMSEFYDPKGMNDEESIRVIHRFLDAGGNFLDTADAYGVGRN